jgi:hypothetical protein
MFSGRILSGDLDAAGAKNASRIWGFMSKFVMLDRFLKALGLTANRSSQSVHRMTSLSGIFWDCFQGIPFVVNILYSLIDSF